MNIKNIAFSGFAAAILAGVCGAADAATVNLASKSYVDNALAGKASIEDFENLESTVGQKATQTALKEVADQVVINTNDIAELKAAGYLTNADLTELQETLQAAIDEKQDKGNYADADELAALKTTVENLQTGNVDKTVIENLQTTVNTISADYAKKSELTATEERLQAAIDAINVPSLEGYVKASDLATVATSGSYADLKDKPTIPSIEGLATSDELTTLQTTLQAAIADKQAKGDYAALADMTAAKAAIEELKTGKADASTVTAIQETISKLGDTYASKADMTAADEALQAAIDAVVAQIPTKVSELDNDAGYITSTALNGYAKSADIEAAYATKESVAGLVTSEQLTNIQNTLQTAIDGKQAAGEYAAAADLTALQEQVRALQEGGSAGVDLTELSTRIQTIENTYATDAELTAAIDAVKALIPSADNFATKDEIAGFMSAPSNPGMGSYLMYASCTNKKCNFSLKTIEELFPDVGGDVGGL